MGWAPLTHATTWERASEITADLDPSCIACSNRYSLKRVIQPIVSRKKVGDWWYNYLEDGTFKKTTAKVYNSLTLDGNPKGSYVPYIFVPDIIPYLELLSYFKQNLTCCLDTYKTVMVYHSPDGSYLTYSAYHGIFQASLSLPFDNPMLTFIDAYPYSLQLNPLK